MPFRRHQEGNRRLAGDDLLRALRQFDAFVLVSGLFQLGDQCVIVAVGPGSIVSRRACLEEQRQEQAGIAGRRGMLRSKQQVELPLGGAFAG